MTELKHTRRVTIELSNRCNMAVFHKKCPLHGQTEPVVLPSSIVFDILTYLGKRKYDEFVAFHNYSDPMNDPRLFWFVEKCKLLVPKARVFILTNGWFLSESMMRDLERIRIGKLYVSAYSDSEYKRLSKLKTSKFKYRVTRITELDERLTGYAEGQKSVSWPCYSPLGEVVIRCTGDVVVCCRDWDNRHVFGNVKKTKLKNILTQPEMLKMYKRLSSGDRYLDICKVCRMKGRYN